MPYKNIVYAKLEKRLLNDWRWFTLDEQTQLIYIKLILVAQETYNKIPKDFAILKALFHTNLQAKTIKESIKSIKINFPRFTEGENYYYYEDFESKTNYIRESPGSAQVLPKVGTEKKRKEKSIKEKEKEVFNEARIIYPGTKRGLDVEFTNFKKHKDWETYLPLIHPAIERQIKHRAEKKQLEQFIPEWKHFKTWVNNRSWEEEYEKINTDGSPNIYTYFEMLKLMKEHGLKQSEFEFIEKEKWIKK